MIDFMDEFVYPAEPVYAQQLAANARDRPHDLPQIVEDLKVEARKRGGLWNLFLPDVSGLSNLDYAYVAEVTGRSPYLAPDAINSNAPSSGGNMEILHLFGTEEQKWQWLEPLLDGTMRSGVCNDRTGRRVVGCASDCDVDRARR